LRYHFATPHGRDGYEQRKHYQSGGGGDSMTHPGGQRLPGDRVQVTVFGDQVAPEIVRGALMRL